MSGLFADHNYSYDVVTPTATTGAPNTTTSTYTNLYTTLIAAVAASAAAVTSSTTTTMSTISPSAIVLATDIPGFSNTTTAIISTSNFDNLSFIDSIMMADHAGIPNPRGPANDSSKPSSSSVVIRPVPVINQPFQALLLILILVAAIVTNGSVILNISRDSLKLRMVHFLLIRHVCITDSVGALFVLPVPLVSFIKGYWDWGPSACTVISTTTACCWTMHLVAVALYRADRVFAVWLPTGRYPIVSARVVNVLLVLVWATALSGSYLATYAFTPTFQPALALCIPNVPLVFFILVFAGYCMGLILLTTGYVYAFIRRRRKRKKRKRQQVMQQQQQQQNHHHHHNRSSLKPEAYVTTCTSTTKSAPQLPTTTTDWSNNNNTRVVVLLGDERTRRRRSQARSDEDEDERMGNNNTSKSPPLPLGSTAATSVPYNMPSGSCDSVGCDDNGGGDENTTVPVPAATTPPSNNDSSASGSSCTPSTSNNSFNNVMSNNNGNHNHSNNNIRPLTPPFHHHNAAAVAARVHTHRRVHSDGVHVLGSNVMGSSHESVVSVQYRSLSSSKRSHDNSSDEYTMAHEAEESVAEKLDECDGVSGVVSSSNTNSEKPSGEHNHADGCDGDDDNGASPGQHHRRHHHHHYHNNNNHRHHRGNTRAKRSRSAKCRVFASYAVSIGHLILYLPAMMVAGLFAARLPPVVAFLCATVVYCEFIVQPIALLLVSPKLRNEVVQMVKGYYSKWCRCRGGGAGMGANTSGSAATTTTQLAGQPTLPSNGFPPGGGGGVVLATEEDDEDAEEEEEEEEDDGEVNIEYHCCDQDAATSTQGNGPGFGGNSDSSRNNTTSAVVVDIDKD